MTLKLNHPTPDEYASFYADYVQRAIAREDVLAALPKQIDEVGSALDHLSDQQALYKFGPAEWSIKEVVGHLNDVERVFSYRLLRMLAVTGRRCLVLTKRITSALQAMTPSHWRNC